MVIQTKEITDEPVYREYVSKARKIIEEAGGKYIVSSDDIIPMGDWSPKRIIIIEFESGEAMKACFESEEYRAIVHLREKSVVGSAVIVK